MSAKLCPSCFEVVCSCPPPARESFKHKAGKCHACSLDLPKHESLSLPMGWYELYTTRRDAAGEEFLQLEYWCDRCFRVRGPRKWVNARG